MRLTPPCEANVASAGTPAPARVTGAGLPEGRQQVSIPLRAGCAPRPAGADPTGAVGCLWCQRGRAVSCRARKYATGNS